MSIEVLSVRGLRPEYGKVDRDLWLWFCEAKKVSENFQGPRVTKRLVQAKAKQAFQAAGIFNFKASDGWYIRWLKRWHRSSNDSTRLKETSPTKKNGESTLICNRRTFRGTKCKPAGSTTTDPAKEKCCSSSIVTSVAIDNLPDVLSNKCQLKSVTMTPHELIAVSPDIASGSCSDPNVFYDSTQVHIDCNTSSRDFEHSCLLKNVDLHCGRVNPIQAANPSMPTYISLEGLSWNGLQDVPHLDRLDLTTRECHGITNEHLVCATKCFPPPEKKALQLPLQGKGKLQAAPTFICPVSHSGHVLSLTNHTVANHEFPLPKEKVKPPSSETYADFDETACMNFAHHDIEDVSVSSDFVNQLYDEQSLEMYLEHGQENLSQQVIKKTVSSKLSQKSNASQSVRNDLTSLASSNPSFAKVKLFNDGRERPDSHVNEAEDDFSSKENDFISEAVLLSMQEDDFSILECEQSPLHGPISVVDENSQLFSDQENGMDDSLQKTPAIQENASESLEIMFSPCSTGHFGSASREHIFVGDKIAGESLFKTCWTSPQSSNNVVQVNNNIYEQPEEKSEKQYFISFPLLNEEQSDSATSQNPLFFNTFLEKKYSLINIKDKLQVSSPIDQVMADSSSPHHNCLIGHDVLNPPLAVEGESIPQLMHPSNNVSSLDRQDFIENAISESVGANSTLIDQDVAMTTFSTSKDVTLPSTCFLGATSSEDSPSLLASKTCAHISNVGIASLYYLPLNVAGHGHERHDTSTNKSSPPDLSHSSESDPSILKRYEYLKKNEITSASMQNFECDPGSSVSTGKKGATFLTERSKINMVAKDNLASYRRSSGDRYFPYFKDKVANYALKHTAKEAAKYFNVNVDTVTMWTRGRLDTDSAVKNHPDQIMLHWLKISRQNGTIVTREQIFEKATQLLKTCENQRKNKSRWFHVWATRLAEVEKKKRSVQNVQEINDLSTDCAEKKALYPDEFKVEVVLYAEQTSKNHASTTFNIARKRVSEWTAAYKVIRNDKSDEPASTIHPDQSSNISLGGERSRISAAAPFSSSDCENVRLNVNSKGVGRAVTNLAVDHELWLWFCEQTSKKRKPKSKEIQAKAVELFRVHNHGKIQCSHGWLKKWSVRFGIALRHEGDNDLLAWCLEQFDRNRNISHRELLGYAHELLAGTHKSDFKASAGWLVRFCKRHRNLLSKKPSIDTEIPITLKHYVSEFRSSVQKLIQSSMIPLSSIGSIDEIPLNFTAAGGSQSRLLLRRSGLENCHAIVILCCLASGEFLPPAIIFKGEGPTEHIICDNISLLLFYQKDCCMTDTIMTQWLECVWNMAVASPSVLIADCYDPHCSELVKEKGVASNVSLCIIPAGCSYKLQPLDVAVSPLFETSIYDRWRGYFFANNHLSASRKNCYSSNSVIAQWVAETLNNLVKTQKEAICRSFVVTGLTCAPTGTEDHFIEDTSSASYSPCLVSK